MKKLLFGVLVATFVLFTVTAAAGARTPSLKRLAKSVASLQRQVAAQEKTIAALQNRVSDQASTITALRGSKVMALNPFLTITAAGRAGAVNGVAGPNVVLKGVNLQIKSATAEGDSSGLGNLIVGWNDSPNPLPLPFRSGSNNLIVGDNNNFTSSGSFVAGLQNTVSGNEASVLGGQRNIASGQFASVGGGGNNTASGFMASVGGGALNIASGGYASVSGGNSNTASGADASVSGGYTNTASTDSASVSGGQNITQNNNSGWSAGTYHTP
jgi:trimeric autotransporter adhesin